MDRNGKIVGGCIAVDLWNREDIERNCRDNSNVNLRQEISPGGPIRLFFLSHLHADHTFGLNSSWSYGPIYTSPLNVKLAAKIIPDLGATHNLLVPLELNTSHLIPLGDSENDPKVRVTLIDANHVPGAVMFVFNGFFGNVVYTGDFRYTPPMCENQALKKLINWEDIDEVFLDNTYFFSKCTFGSRIEVIEKVIAFIKQHDSHHFYIGANRLGKEHAFVKIAVALNERICVDSERLSIFRELKLPDVFTLDPGNARIFIVNRNMLTKNFLISENQKRPTIGMNLSALFYNWEDNCPYYNSEVWDLYFFEYSDHSSYQEIIDFIKILKPKKVVPIVNSSKSDRNWLKRRKGFEDERNDMRPLRQYLSTLPCKNFGFPTPKIHGLPNTANNFSEFGGICKKSSKHTLKPTPRRIYRGPKGAVYDSSTTTKADSASITSDKSRDIEAITMNGVISNKTTCELNQKVSTEPPMQNSGNLDGIGKRCKSDINLKRSRPFSELDSSYSLLVDENSIEQVKLDSGVGQCLKVVKVSENKDEEICYVGATHRKINESGSETRCLLKHNTSDVSKANKRDFSKYYTEGIDYAKHKNNAAHVNGRNSASREELISDHMEIDNISNGIVECSDMIMEKRYKEEIDENDISVLNRIDQNLSNAENILDKISCNDIK